MAVLLSQLLFLTCFFLFKSVESFKTGASDSQCEEMTPDQGISPQRSASPYQIQIQKNNANGGEPLKIRLSGPEVPFKEFFAMGYKLGSERDPPGPRVIGSIREIKETKSNFKYIDCFGIRHSAITHTDESPKNSVEFEWIAPNEDGKFVILATFVQEKKKIKVSSAPILVKRNSNFFPQDEQSENSDRDKNPDVFDAIIDELRTKYYSGCGITKGCFGIPPHCIELENCEMFTSWRYDGRSSDYKFQIAGRLPGWTTYEEATQLNQGHISTGLSFDEKMGQDSVIGCVFKDGFVKPKSYFNLQHEKQNSIFKNESTGLVGKGRSGKYVNGFMFCEFGRTVLMKDGTGELGKDFDLNKDRYYIMMARSKSLSINKANGREKLGHHADDLSDKGVSGTAILLKEAYTDTYAEIPATGDGSTDQGQGGGHYGGGTDQGQGGGQYGGGTDQGQGGGQYGGGSSSSTTTKPTSKPSVPTKPSSPVKENKTNSGGQSSRTQMLTLVSIVILAFARE